jgi:hypothetical protein
MPKSNYHQSIVSRIASRYKSGLAIGRFTHDPLDALSFIRNRVAPGTEIMADESHAWNDLGARFAMRRINHQ